MNMMHKTLAGLTQKAEAGAAEKTGNIWRLRFHLEPPVGWLNDPNGLSYYEDTFHIFYQYAPFDDRGGLKFWGHYRSRDLISWDQMPVMLFADEPFDVHGAYSGSALPHTDGLYLFYTGNVKYEGEDYDYVLAGREQNTVLAVTRDGIHAEKKTLLMTNADYPQGMTRHVRDPKVFAFEGRYYMVLGARTKTDTGVVLLYASDNLYDWEYVRTLTTETPLGYMWECPDLFCLDGQWVLMVSPQGIREDRPGFDNAYTSGYMVLDGDFRSQCTLGPFRPLDYGFDFYAPQTFDSPRGRLLVGWMGMPDADYENPTVRYGYQHALTTVRKLHLDSGVLRMQPVEETDSLRKTPAVFSVPGEITTPAPETFDLHIRAEGPVSIDISGAALTVRDGWAELTLHEGGWGRTVRRAPVTDSSGFRILADTSSLEVFFDDGSICMTTRWYPPQEQRTLKMRGTAAVEMYTMDPFLYQVYGQEKVQ